MQISPRAAHYVTRTGVRRRNTRQAVPETLLVPKFDPEVPISFKVRLSDAPALRSAIEEIRSKVGTRLEGKHRYAKEQALTNAARAIAALAAAVNEKAAGGDPDYA